MKEMEAQIHAKEKQFERILDRRIMEEKLNDSHQKSVELQEFCVQTDQEDEGNGEYFLSINKTKNHSFIEDFTSTQRDTLNWIKNAGSFQFELEEKDRVYAEYDYYTEIGLLHCPELTFEEKIKRQLRMINYISKMKSIAVETLKDYIDSERPKKCCNFRGTLF